MPWQGEHRLPRSGMGFSRTSRSHHRIPVRCGCAQSRDRSSSHACPRGPQGEAGPEPLEVWRVGAWTGQTWKPSLPSWVLRGVGQKDLSPTRGLSLGVLGWPHPGGQGVELPFKGLFQCRGVACFCGGRWQRTAKTLGVPGNLLQAPVTPPGCSLLC